ncbi:MAG: hypothetical protein ACJARD_000597 [Alphaproteobacteria bacterium]|jgi:hypothetical protein
MLFLLLILIALPAKDQVSDCHIPHITFPQEGGRSLGAFLDYSNNIALIDIKGQGIDKGIDNKQKIKIKIAKGVIYITILLLSHSYLLVMISSGISILI